MTDETKQTVQMKWQERDRPSWPGNEPPWHDCRVGEDGKPETVWLQCEYRNVPADTKSERNR